MDDIDSASTVWPDGYRKCSGGSLAIHNAVSIGTNGVDFPPPLVGKCTSGALAVRRGNLRQNIPEIGIDY